MTAFLKLSDSDQTAVLPGPECSEGSMTETSLTTSYRLEEDKTLRPRSLQSIASLLSLTLLAALVAGCDPASAEYGTVEIASDTPTLTEEILKPPGVEVPPRLAKKAVQPPTGPTAVIPSKK
jgi:hypothetical protein